MKSEFKAVTKHTDQVLRDFVRFTYKVNYPKATYRLCVLAVGFGVLVPFLRHQPGMQIFCIAAGLVILGFAFLRHRIGAAKLAKRDQNYIQQTAIEFWFRGDRFSVSPAGGEKQEFPYREVSSFYKDKRNFYLVLNEQEVQMFPMADLNEETAVEFEEFMQRKSGQVAEKLNPSLRERLANINRVRKQAEREHDEKIAKKHKKTRG